MSIFAAEDRFVHDVYSYTAPKRRVGPPQVAFAIHAPSCVGCMPSMFVAAHGRDRILRVRHQAGPSACCWAAIARQVDDVPLMEYTVCTAHDEEDFLRAMATIAAAFEMTSGGETWMVRRPDQTIAREIPFCIGRELICMRDGGGNDVVKYATRGRAGVYRTTSHCRGTERVVSCRGEVSHPQVPLLRELVRSAKVGTVRLVGAKVQWKAEAGARCAAPLMVAHELPECDALVVDAAVIHLRVNPVIAGPVGGV